MEKNLWILSFDQNRSHFMINDIEKKNPAKIKHYKIFCLLNVSLNWFLSVTENLAKLLFISNIKNERLCNRHTVFVDFRFVIFWKFHHCMCSMFLFSFFKWSNYFFDLFKMKISHLYEEKIKTLLMNTKNTTKWRNLSFSRAKKKNEQIVIFACISFGFCI